MNNDEHDYIKAVIASIGVDIKQYVTGNLVHAADQLVFSELHERQLVTCFGRIQKSIRDTFFAPHGGMIDMVRNPWCASAMEDIYNKLFENFMEHYWLLNTAPSIHTHIGVFTHRQLMTLIIATVDEARTIASSQERRQSLQQYCACDFPAVRRMVLAVNSNTPISQYTLSELMLALYALYEATPCMLYDSDVERYMFVLLWRARHFLVRPEGARVHDVAELRIEVSGASIAYEDNTKLFKYAPLFLRDFTVISHGLVDWFDRAHLLKRDDTPPITHITIENMRCARYWIGVHASCYLSRVMQDAFIKAMVRSGESEFFQMDAPNKEPTDHEIIRRYRLQEFLTLMEIAQFPPHNMVRKFMPKDSEFDSDPWVCVRDAKHNNMQLVFAMLSVFMDQLYVSNTAIETSKYVILAHEFTNERATELKQEPLASQPVLVVCCNRVQLCYKGTMYMYNNALLSIITWMLLVHRTLNGCLGEKRVDSIIDNCLYPFEKDAERIKRKRSSISSSDQRNVLVDLLGVF